MINAFKIPDGLALLMSVGSSNDYEITDIVQYRPDKVTKFLYGSSVHDEIINNALSNVSPISCTNGKKYTVSNVLFRNFFAR